MRVDVVKEERRNDDQRQITEADLEALTDLVSDKLAERAAVKLRLIKSVIAWILRFVGAGGTALALWHHEAIKLSLFG